MYVKVDYRWNTSLAKLLRPREQSSFPDFPDRPCNPSLIVISLQGKPSLSQAVTLTVAQTRA